VVKSKDGRMHPNVQRAMAADKMPPMKAKPMAGPPKMGGGAPEAPAMETEGDGQSPVHEHLAAMHSEMGGTHMHIHGHSMGHTTHHVGHDGTVQGPHEHPSMDSVKSHMDRVFSEGEGEHEGGGTEGEGAGEGAY
jgi:hypothetical protein